MRLFCLRIIVFCTLAVLGSACRPGPRVSAEQRAWQARMDAEQAAYLAKVRPWAGCYVLQLGPWQYQDSARTRFEQDTPSFLPSAVIRLDTVYERGRLHTLPRPDSAAGFDPGYWQWYRDTLELRWDKTGWFATTYHVVLVRQRAEMVGRAQMEWHHMEGRIVPFRDVRARRTACAS